MFEDKKAVIFDLDGVLCDTAKYHYEAWNELAQKLGFVFTINDNERLKGVSRMQSLEILLEIGNIKIDDEQKEKYAEEKNKRYVEFISKMPETDLFSGVREFINFLKSKGIKSAIGSASKNTPIILDRLKIADLFDVISDGNSITNAKPDPEVFINAANLLNVKYEDCVVIEDSVAGIEAANNCGMFSIGIGNARVLSSANAVFASIEELYEKTNK